jgi:hypothetical protein
MMSKIKGIAGVLFATSMGLASIGFADTTSDSTDSNTTTGTTTSNMTTNPTLATELTLMQVKVTDDKGKIITTYAYVPKTQTDTIKSGKTIEMFGDVEAE